MSDKISIREKKYIKSLQIKKYRQHHQAFLVEGWKSVEELLQSNYKIELLFVTEKYAHQCNGRVVDASEINQVSSLANNQEAIAVVKMPENNHTLDLNGPVFVFDGIQDPGNLGTIIRTADWLGFQHIICSTDSVDFYNPKVITSTKGSFTRIVPQYVDLETFLKNTDAKEVYLTDMEGDDYRQVELRQNIIIIFGNESKGVSSKVSKLVKNRLTIKKKGKAESLNVAMSFGIIAASIK